MAHEQPQWFQDALAVPYTEDYVSVNGAKVHYLRWGEQNTKTLVVVHGNGAHAHWFHFIGALLSHKYQVVAVTLSGMGDSGWRDIYTRESMVQDVFGLIEQLSLKNVHLMGHSFGGLITLCTAQLLGSDCQALIMADFFPRSTEDTVEWFNNREPGRPTKVYPTLKEILARFRLEPIQPCENQYLVDFIARKSVREVAGGYTWKFDHTIYDNMKLGSDTAAILNSLSCPSGLIYGANTQVEQVGILDKIQKIFPEHSPIVALPDARHHLMLDQPLAYIKELDKMFDGLVEG